ncbi:phage major tail tube protein [Solidesulfovibrio sp.]
MSIINRVPEKLINYKVFRDGVDLVGLADVDLPDVEHLSESLSGSGLAGEFDSPTIGHTKDMTLKMKFRTIYKPVVGLVEPKPVLFDLRLSVQAVDAGTSEYSSYPSRIVVRGVPKKKGLGKLDPGKKMDNEIELAVTYLKIYVDDDEVLEVDKLNFIFKVNGVDALAQVRAHLGMIN